MVYYLKPPPLPLPVYHHFLKTRSLLWTSPQLARALVQVTTSLAAPEPAGDLLPCILADLRNHYDDLDFLDGEGEAEAWGNLGIRTIPARHVLGQILEQMQKLVGSDASLEPAVQREFGMSPVKAWFNCWVDGQTARAVHCLGNAAMFFHMDTDDGPPWVGDALDAMVAGLVCDLPLLAGHMEFAASALPEMKADLYRLADAIRQEAGRLRRVYTPFWDTLWAELCAGQLDVATRHRRRGLVD